MIENDGNTVIAVLQPIVMVYWLLFMWHIWQSFR